MDIKHLDARDYLAAKAMQGIMVGDNPASHHPEMVADWAYKIAEAMLERRLTPNPKNI